uniref:Uncharacterized protein n=1 Tax=Chelonoidis abingdonii TaxID=106734 RepID=A0A8C0H6J8_CHEAB
MWNKIIKDLEEWNKYEISWLGRVALVKMNVLPKLLFLFQCIPVGIPEMTLNTSGCTINIPMETNDKGKVTQDLYWCKQTQNWAFCHLTLLQIIGYQQYKHFWSPTQCNYIGEPQGGGTIVKPTHFRSRTT